MNAHLPFFLLKQVADMIVLMQALHHDRSVLFVVEPAVERVIVPLIASATMPRSLSLRSMPCWRRIGVLLHDSRRRNVKTISATMATRQLKSDAQGYDDETYSNPSGKPGQFNLRSICLRNSRSRRHADQPLVTASGLTDMPPMECINYNINVLIRKQSDAPFRWGLELATSHAAVSPEIARRYTTTPDGGVIPADQVKSLSWQERQSEFAAAAPLNIIAEVRAKVKALLSF
jgi:hypothetical protein